MSKTNHLPALATSGLQCFVEWKNDQFESTCFKTGWDLRCTFTRSGFLVHDFWPEHAYVVTMQCFFFCLTFCDEEKQSSKKHGVGIVTGFVYYWEHFGVNSTFVDLVKNVHAMYQNVTEIFIPKMAEDFCCLPVIYQRQSPKTIRQPLLPRIPKETIQTTRWREA